MLPSAELYPVSSARQVLTAPRHLRPTAPAAGRAILVGDPGRALFLSQKLIDKPPPMFNHHRGLWGYSGVALDGERLIVQATGIGGPSLVAVATELASLGVGAMIRIGTCSPIAGLRAGQVVVATSATQDGGAAARISSEEIHRPDIELTAALVALFGEEAEAAPVASGDLAFEAPVRPGEAIAHDLSTAALFAVAPRLGLRVAAALITARDADGEIDDGALEAVVEATGITALGALAPETPA